jgi:sterol 14-demethylase
MINRNALREEYKKVVKGDKFRFEHLKDLELLDACIRETLRLHPPIVSIMRKVTKPVTYKNYVIPAGDYLCGSPAISQLDPNVYENPMLFDPYRWVGKKDDDSSTIDYGFGSVPLSGAKSSYLPFGAGMDRAFSNSVITMNLW